MMDRSKVAYAQLETGYAFPSVEWKLDAGLVSDYVRAVGESHAMYEGAGTVPPTAVAAWALASLLDVVALPFGTIHLSQEIESMSVAKAGDTMTCRAKVTRKQERSRLRLLDIEVDVINQDGAPLLRGKSSFNLPQETG